MIRIIARLVLNVLSNAVGLAAAAIILDGFTIDSLSFVIAVIIFSITTGLLGPFITSVALKNANYLIGGIALVTTLAGLIITDVLSSGISINGLSTWILATLVVWIFSIIGNLLLPLLIFKKTLQKIKDN